MEFLPASFTRATPCSMDFSAQATASRGILPIRPSLVASFFHPCPLFRVVCQFLCSSNAHVICDGFSFDIKDSSEIAGKPKLLLTWFGKSLLPVAMIRAPASSASQGQISGIGFAQAKTIESFAIVLIHSFFIVLGPGLEAATTASTPLKASDMSLFCFLGWFFGLRRIPWVFFFVDICSFLVDYAFAVLLR